MEPEQARATIEQAIAGLARDLPRLDARNGCARLQWLRRSAILAGCVPVVVLADGLASAIARDGHQVPLRSWIDALTLAAGCGTDNEDAGPLLLATVGVRFAA